MPLLKSNLLWCSCYFMSGRVELRTTFQLSEYYKHKYKRLCQNASICAERRVMMSCPFSKWDKVYPMRVESLSKTPCSLPTCFGHTQCVNRYRHKNALDRLKLPNAKFIHCHWLSYSAKIFHTNLSPWWVNWTTCGLKGNLSTRFGSGFNFLSYKYWQTHLCSPIHQSVTVRKG